MVCSCQVLLGPQVGRLRPSRERLAFPCVWKALDTGIPEMYRCRCLEHLVQIVQQEVKKSAYVSALIVDVSCQIGAVCSCGTANHGLYATRVFNLVICENMPESLVILMSVMFNAEGCPLAMLTAPRRFGSVKKKMFSCVGHASTYEIVSYTSVHLSSDTTCL